MTKETYKCEDCGREKEASFGLGITKVKCKECGGEMKIPSESNLENSQEETDEEQTNCLHCKKKIFEDNEYQCDECEDEPICKNCILSGFDAVSICKKCIDKEYPRKEIIKEVPKFIEKNFPIKSQENIDFEGKSKFD